MTVAQRLCDAGHYAAPSIRLQVQYISLQGVKGEGEGAASV